MGTFISPTRGKLTFDQVFAEILAYVDQDPETPYKLIVGSDSQTKEEQCFVSAIVIHRTGKGARYFYQKTSQRQIRSLRQKIFYETALSLNLASRLAEKLASCPLKSLQIEIHLDVGTNGDTKELIREITGMVMGSGFDPKIKPDSYGASKVADKHTK